MWSIADQAGMVTPESLAAASASMGGDAVHSPLQSSPQQMNFDPQLNNAHLPDLTAMMFPSADPFAYPNQPMSALEDGPFKQDPNGMSFPGSNNMFYPNGTSSSSISYENLAMPMFGSLPPFLMQQGQSSLSGPMENGHFQPVDPSQSGDPGSLTTDQSYWQHMGRQGKAPGVNLDEIFGNEDWSAGWMSRGFPQ